MTGNWVQAKGVNRGANDAGYDGRHRHAAWGAEQAAEACGGSGRGQRSGRRLSVPVKDVERGCKNDRCGDDYRY